MNNDSPKQILTPKNLTNEECRQILMEMDREGKNFWEEQKGNLVAALQDDLKSFGEYETSKFVIKASPV